MINFKFYCRGSRVGRDGKSPLEISITVSGSRLFVMLPMKYNPTEFKKSMSSKRGNEIKDYTEQITKLVNGGVTEIIRRGETVTSDKLKEWIRNGGKFDEEKPYSVNDLFKDYDRVMSKRSDITELSKEKYRIVMNEFRAYTDCNRDVNTITYGEIDEFYLDLTNRFKQSTAVSKITKLKSIFIYGFNNDKVKKNVTAQVKVQRAKPCIEYLTDEELGAINRDYHCDRLNQVRDIVLFQSGCGLAYCDVASLTKDDVKEYNSTLFINKARQKTGIEFTAVLLPIAREIWLKYNGSLPIITNQRMNAYLKEIQVLSGVNKNLHTHLFRKTYATHLINSGVRMETVSKCLGHSNSKITASTYAHIVNTTILEEVANLGSQSTREPNLY